MTPPWSVAHVRVPELMDDPSLDAGEHLEALHALGRINTLSRTAAQLAAGIRRLVGDAAVTPVAVRVVDVACGGGDVTVDLARRLGLGWHVTGIDVSARAVDRAARLADGRGVANASFAVSDVLADGCPACDVVVSSLFLHHLEDGPAGDVLRGMAAAAGVGGVVSDLVRSRRGLFLARLVTNVLTGSRVARIDGPLSVRAARTLQEHRDLVASAGLAAASVRPAWPQRVVIEWTAPPRRVRS